MDFNTGIIIANAARNALELGNNLGGVDVGCAFDAWYSEKLSTHMGDIAALNAVERTAEKVVKELKALGLGW